MKEKLYTIELTDAVRAGDECCFCWLERKLEQEKLEFVLGSSYMESDTREQTDREGFCRRHTKMMYQYGNTLGNAWILKSRMEFLRSGLEKQAGRPAAGGGEANASGTAAAKKSGIFGRMKKNGGGAKDASAASTWIRDQGSHCYICSRMEEVYARMLDTFIYLLQNDAGFGGELLQSKGLCLPHFADVLDICARKLSAAEQETWIPKLTEWMERNLDRVQEDVNWLIEKYDYRNKDADWRQSQDAVQRAMQKAAGGHPADPPFQCRK